MADGSHDVCAWPPGRTAVKPSRECQVTSQSGCAAAMSAAHPSQIRTLAAAACAVSNPTPRTMPAG
jgi:hypothetical protein